MRAPKRHHGRRVALLGLAAAMLIGTGSASAQSGGAPPPGYATAPTGKARKAKLTKKGKAIPPSFAPPAVQAAIYAGNMIRKKPYRWGGGHRTFYDRAYDCSGAVSFVLWAAGILDSAMPSGAFTTWGSPGHGSWISVFANKRHMYMVVAGRRFDTSSAGDRRSRGKGPRWRKKKRKPKGYAIRHYPSL